MIIGNLFNIILFLTAMGSLTCILVLFIGKVFRLEMPFALYLASMLFFAVPLLVPGLKLIPPEKQIWIEPYLIADKIWIAGLLLFLAFTIFRILLAAISIRKLTKCNNERIIKIFGQCVIDAGLKKIPPLLAGHFTEPACVIAAAEPKVILRESIIGQLSDDELAVLFTHELMHIKRKHTLLQRIYDFICCVHWFNPFAWIGRHEFFCACEVDCDRAALLELKGKTDAVKYAKTMLRLMELNVEKKKTGGISLGFMDFLLAKQRFSTILFQSSKMKRIVSLCAGIILICFMIAISTIASRSYFYPYPALSSGIEWSDGSHE